MVSNQRYLPGPCWVLASTLTAMAAPTVEQMNISTSKRGETPRGSPNERDAEVCFQYPGSDHMPRHE